MSSERIKHDGSARCPVEPEALVHVRSEHGGTVGDPRLAHRIEWSPLVKEYTVISGWNRPIADIFAELPDEAEWIYTDIHSAFMWAPSEPKLGERCFINPDGWPCARPPAIHHGDWRESKRKRPEPELPEIERVGLARAKAQMKAKPAPWFVVVGFPDGGAMFTHCETREAADEIAIAEAKDGNEAFVCRAVASFTAKVERTTYENGGE